MGIGGGENILLTGLSRGGTSIACTLLNLLPNVAALVEPMSPENIPADVSPAELKRIVDAFCADARAAAISSSRILTRHSAGVVVSNQFTEPGEAARRSRVKRGWIDAGRQFDDAMLLVIKHPAAFTALADKLRVHFPLFCIIRDPLYVICSWRSIPAAISIGRLHMGERFDPELRQCLARIDDLLDRQVAIANWFFGRYLRFDQSRIIRYEEIVSTGGRALHPIDRRALGLAQSLTSHNSRGRYAAHDVGMVAERLKRTGGPFTEFYDAEWDGA